MHLVFCTDHVHTCVEAGDEVFPSIHLHHSFESPRTWSLSIIIVCWAKELQMLCGYRCVATRLAFVCLLEIYIHVITLYGRLSHLPSSLCPLRRPTYHVKVGEERSKDGRYQGLVVFWGAEEHEGLHEDTCCRRLRSSSHEQAVLSPANKLHYWAVLQGFRVPTMSCVGRKTTPA